MPVSHGLRKRSANITRLGSFWGKLTRRRGCCYMVFHGWKKGVPALPRGNGAGSTALWADGGSTTDAAAFLPSCSGASRGHTDDASTTARDIVRHSARTGDCPAYFTSCHLLALHLVLWLKQAYGKVPYHDVVIPFDRLRILKEKKSFPFSQLPVLQVLVPDSHEKLRNPPLREISIAQSGSITRFLAPRVGLQPEDPYDAALCDSYFEASQDMARVNPIVNIYVGEQLESEKKKFLKQLPGRLEDIARIFEGKEAKQFLLADRPYYCDMNMCHTLQQVLVLKPDALDQYPALRKYVSNVAALSGMKEYLERRPKLEDLGRNLLYGQRKESEGERTEVDKTGR